MRQITAFDVVVDVGCCKLRDKITEKKNYIKANLVGHTGATSFGE